MEEKVCIECDRNDGETRFYKSRKYVVRDICVYCTSDIRQKNGMSRRYKKNPPKSGVERVCRRCKESKDTIFFSKEYVYCKECSKDIKTDILSKDSKYYRNSFIRTVYNIEPEKYNSILENQNGLCAVCGKTEEENGRALSIDHDHDCCPGSRSCGECIRGILCQSCNVMDGFSKGRPEILFSMIEYLGYDLEEELNKYLQR